VTPTSVAALLDGHAAQLEFRRIVEEVFPDAAPEILAARRPGERREHARVAAFLDRVGVAHFPVYELEEYEQVVGAVPFIRNGWKKQNTIKSTTFSDHQGRLLLSGVIRPGRMHDQTAVKTEGITEQLRLHPGVKAEVDEGYRGLANDFPDQVTPAPRKPRDDAGEGDKRAWREARRRQSSRRIVVEHTNAELKQWHPLQRYTGRRATYAETHLAIAAHVSDRAARRTTRHRHSTDIVLARQTSC
jgi:hypothetical protein